MSSPSPDSTRRNSRSIGSRIASILVGFCIAAVGVYIWNLYRFHVRTVIPGEIYRSAQPTPSQLERTISDYGIASVINLRGRNDRSDWYLKERSVCAKAGVVMYDIPLETFDVPPRTEVRQLAMTLQEAPRPLLLHCESGVDRSAWAATFARIENGEKLASAKKEMSLLNGHFCRKCPLDDFFNAYTSWVAANHLTQTRQNFTDWASFVYCPEPYDARITVTMPRRPHPAPGEPLQAQVHVMNSSTQPWVATADRKKGIRLGARLLGPLREPLPDPLAAFRVPHVKAVDLFRDPAPSRTIRPGEAVDVTVTFRAPEVPGIYYVQFDMVDEYVHWFSDVGRPGAIELLVVARN